MKVPDKKRFSIGRRVLVGMGMLPGTVNYVADVPSAMGEFVHEVLLDGKTETQKVVGCDIHPIPGLDEDLRNMNPPIQPGKLAAERSTNVADDDRKFARLAIDEARKSVSEPDGRPHPLVGAVVVKNGQVLTFAHRGEAPGNHAEYIALEMKLSDEAVAGATVYTTLEPCTTRNHPKIPCAARLIERKVSRVVIGMLDPDERITGRGWRKLRSAGIVVESFPSELVPEVEELNREFTRFCENPDDSVQVPGGNDSKVQGVLLEVTDSDPRIYVDFLDQRKTLHIKTVFSLRNLGKSVAHRVQIHPLKLNCGEATFFPIESLACGQEKQVVPDIEKISPIWRHDISQIMRKEWDAAGDLSVLGFSRPMTISYEDFNSKNKWETTFDLVYHVVQDIVQHDWPLPEKPEFFQVRNVKFRRLSS
jgi:pyrimidine deaminase RibD-like protein